MPNRPKTIGRTSRRLSKRRLANASPSLKILVQLLVTLTFRTQLSAGTIRLRPHQLPIKPHYRTAAIVHIEVLARNLPVIDRLRIGAK